MKIRELLEDEYEPHPALKKSGLKRIIASSMAELAGESKWDLDENLRLHVINAGRKAVIYFETMAPENAEGFGSTSKKGWWMPLDKKHQADFVKRFPWLENISDKGQFDISGGSAADFEDWINLWKHRKQ